MMTPWQKHKAEWKDCDRCPLHESRTKVCLYRGKIPCDVLFVGEAPGASEDVLGQPFVGPAGHLLDTIVEDAVARYDSPLLAADLRMGFTNLVGCIPLGEDGNKTAEPSKEAIAKCRPRLDQVIKIAKPTLVVFVGKLATKHGVALVQPPTLTWVSITHPAAILRADQSQQLLLVQKTTVTLTDAFDEIL